MPDTSADVLHHLDWASVVLLGVGLRDSQAAVPADDRRTSIPNAQSVRKTWRVDAGTFRVRRGGALRGHVPVKSLRRVRATPSVECPGMLWENGTHGCGDKNAMRPLEEIGYQLDQTDKFDPACGEVALATFEFSQNLVELWRGSNSAQKRVLLEMVSSNRKMSDVSLVLIKIRPFDFSR